ncbi:hypothetical protein [Streptomyces sp. CoH27]|uniref:hypothetical protein n=1 Tax=Streptomyces sp. CoH27 TaxID=2875763 RepID=UPI0035A95816
MERKSRAAPQLLRPYWPEGLAVLSLAVCGLAPWHPQAIFWGGVPLAFALFCVTSLRPARTAGVALAAALAMAVSTGLPRFEHTGAVVPFALLFGGRWASRSANGAGICTRCCVRNRTAPIARQRRNGCASPANCTTASPTR